ncbi:CHAP domain-containing protein, partial [Longispora fulva]
MNKQIRRAFAALVATTALTSGLLSAVSPAHAATASDVASLARANEGRHYCDTNSLGGSGFQGPQENSCTGFPWCADFAGWVWANAGDHSIDVNTLTQGSWTFYNYGKNHGTLHTDPNYRPQIGDAAVYNATVDANGYASHADHVGLVTKTNTDGSIEITNGNFGTDNTTSTVLTEVISAAQVPVGSYQSGEGKTVSAYVSPSGLAALPPSSSSSPLQVSGDFNGDGRADMAIMYRRGDGSIQPITALGDTAGHIGGFDLGGTTIPAGAWDWNSFQVYPGDFNGDGRTDLGVMYKQADGRISFMHAMADTTGRIGTFNNAVTIAAAAGWDYNAIRL